MWEEFIDQDNNCKIFINLQSIHAIRINSAHADRTWIYFNNSNREIKRNYEEVKKLVMAANEKKSFFIV